MLHTHRWQTLSGSGLRWTDEFQLCSNRIRTSAGQLADRGDDSPHAVKVQENPVLIFNNQIFFNVEIKESVIEFQSRGCNQNKYLHF